MISQIYPSWLQLNKANSSETEAPFLDLHLSILDGFILCKSYYKRDDFNFKIVNFPYLDVNVPRRTSYIVYILQLIRFARMSSHVTDFNTQNRLLTAEFLNRGYRYYKHRKAFSKFYRDHFDLVSKFNVWLKSLLQQGLSELELYGDLVYKFRKMFTCNDFSSQFRKISLRYLKIEFTITVIRQTACMVINQITVNSFASLFGCTQRVGPQNLRWLRPKDL